jgi:hypothetical protein
MDEGGDQNEENAKRSQRIVNPPWRGLLKTLKIFIRDL